MAERRNTYSFFAVFMLLLLCSCTKEPDAVVPQEESTSFILATKAQTAPGTTFRILAYGCSEEDHFNVISEGTYSLQEKTFGEFPYLTASALDDNGVLLAEDPAKALAVPYEQAGNSFYISYVSPGKIHSDGSFEANLAEPFYCSDVQKTVINNYGLVEMTKDLYDRRAKIGFRFFKTEEAAEKTIEISELAIIGAGNIYWPASKQVTSSTEDILPATLQPVAVDGTLQIYECKEFDDMPFVLSGIYAPKDTVATKLLKDESYALGFAPTNLQESMYLQVQFKMFVDGAGPLLVTAPLTYNAAADITMVLEPLTTYMYNIYVSDTYIKTILQVTPLEGWEEIEFGWEIKDNTEKVYFGEFEFSQWEDNPWEDNKDINSSNN